MLIEKELKEFKTVFDREMSRFLDMKIRDANKISPWAKGFVQDIKGYMMAGGGGKRIRPALMYFGYLALGGKKKEEMIKTAMSVEFLHTCFLIQDDIVDRDDLRHGEMTMHCRYKEWAKKNLELTSAECYHYGVSQAICSADIALEIAFRSLTESSFPENIKLRAINTLNSMLFSTAVGEMSDMLAEDKNSASVERVIGILEYKTAHYTIEGPLHLGAIMAGANEKILKDLSDFSIPLGVAFQLQDDILGVFGSSKETGKPVGADIREGKKTLLIAKTMEKADASQKKDLESALRNHKATVRQIEKAREAIIDTGSLKYSQELAEKLVAKSHYALEKSRFDKKSRKFFDAVAEFMIKRKS